MNCRNVVFASTAVQDLRLLRYPGSCKPYIVGLFHLHTRFNPLSPDSGSQGKSNPIPRWQVDPSLLQKFRFKVVHSPPSSKHRSGIVSLGVKWSTSWQVLSLLSSCWIAYTWVCIWDTGWEHGNFNRSGHWPLGICNPVKTEPSDCRTIRQCNPLLILSSQEKCSLCNW